MKYSPLLMAATLLVAPCLSAQQLKIVQPADIANLKQVSDPRISPDGQQIVYVVTTPVAAGKHKDAHIWITPADAIGQQRPFVYSAGTDISPRWSPDGNSVAFLSDRKNPLADKEHNPFQFSIVNASDRKDLYPPEKKKGSDEAPPEMQLWEISLHGGEAVPLTNIPGGIKSFKWSKDGKFLAFIRTDQDTKDEHDRKLQKYDEIVVNQNYKYDRLWIYDLARHQARLLTKSDINIDDFDWSPDGTRILARVSPTPRIDDYWRVSKVVVLDSGAGNVVKTLAEHSGFMQVRWSPDGHRVAFSRMTPKRISDVHFVYDLDTGKQVRLESTFPGTIYDMVWSPDSRSVLIEGVEGAHMVVVRADAASGAITPMPDITTPATSITMSKDGNTISFLGQTTVHPDEVWTYSRDHSQMLTETNPQVKDWALGTEREIEWKSSKDGLTIHGVLDLPPGYQKGKRYKTIVHVHGGPEEATVVGWHGDWYNYAAMSASHGYVVLLPNPRGSAGAGPAFSEANYQDWGGGDFQDIMDGVDSLIAKGITDPDRMAIGGWSYGGFMTDWAVTHTNRFKAAMSGAGVADLFSMATTTDISPSFERGYFGKLADNSKLYDEHSPVRYLSQCHTPVLVMGGEADQRVPISQSEEFYNGLHFLGRDAEMVRYPREPHIFTEREHQIDSLRRILAWYDSHLKP